MIACRSILCLSCASILMFYPSADGQGWTRFRGPNGSGISEATTIPVNWTTRDYQWRVKLPGIGYSSPVIWGGRIFVSAAMQEDGTRIICCLDHSDGQMIWKRSFPSTTFELGNATAYDAASPTVDDQRVYMTWATPEHYIVLALDQQKGREVWRRDLGRFGGDHGFGASPVLFEELLIVPNDQSGTSFVVALDRSTGQTRWKVDRRTAKTAYSTPIIYHPQDGPPQLILTCTAHGISSLDPRSGKLNWEFSLFGKERVVGSAVIGAGLVFASCGTGGGGKRMFAIKPGDPARGSQAEVAYELTGSLPYVPTPVAHGRLLFFFNDQGVVSCVDAPTGKILWRQRVGGKYFGSPVRVADRLYCISREGEMVVLAAAEEFKELARMDLEERSNSTPAIADGVMYIRTVSHLMAIGEKRGRESF